MPKATTGIASAGLSSVTLPRPLYGKRTRAGSRWPDAGATQSTEVRWFVPGAGPRLEGAPVRSCIDSYNVDMLADGVSVKSRVGHGAGIFVKVRSAVLPPIVVGDLCGTPETWMRWEVGARPLSAAEVHVHKVIARRKGVEVAHLVVHGQQWWSVAVRVRGPGPTRLPLEIELHLAQQDGEAHCCSYPTWLGLHTTQRSRSSPAGWTDTV